MPLFERSPCGLSADLRRMTGYGSTRSSIRLSKAFNLSAGSRSASASSLKSEDTTRFGVAANAEWDKLQRGEFDTASAPSSAGSAHPLKSMNSRSGGGLVKKLGLFSPRSRTRLN